VSEARVLDHTAIVALFKGDEQVFRLWQQANEEELTLVMPAVAVAEANNVIGADGDAWRPVLDASSVVVTVAVPRRRRADLDPLTLGGARRHP
jgi:hypothetical protein